MKANLCRHDIDLLLLVHDEVSPLRRLVTKFHIASCASCQARLVELTTVSRLVSSALSRPGAATTIPTPQGFNPKRLTIMLALTVLVVLAIGAANAVRYLEPVTAQSAPLKVKMSGISLQSCGPGSASGSPSTPTLRQIKKH